MGTTRKIFSNYRFPEVVLSRNTIVYSRHDNVHKHFHVWETVKESTENATEHRVNNPLAAEVK